jgi:hypothetical protein
MFPLTFYWLFNCLKNWLFRLPDFGAIWPCDVDTGKGSVCENRSHAQARPNALPGRDKLPKRVLLPSRNAPC